MERPKVSYKHGEAFALMWYGCTCGHREVIWNSRDGVTPFGMFCPSCGTSDLRHVDWARDVCAPEYKPRIGQRYFSDGTAEEAVWIIERRIVAFAEKGNPIPRRVANQMLKEAREQTGDEWPKGWPKIQRVEMTMGEASAGLAKLWGTPK